MPASKKTKRIASMNPIECNPLVSGVATSETQTVTLIKEAFANAECAEWGGETIKYIDYASKQLAKMKANKAECRALKYNPGDDVLITLWLPEGITLSVCVHLNKPLGDKVGYSFHKGKRWLNSGTDYLGYVTNKAYKTARIILGEIKKKNKKKNKNEDKC